MTFRFVLLLFAVGILSTLVEVALLRLCGVL